MSALICIARTACAIAPSVCESRVLGPAPGNVSCTTRAQGATARDLVPGWRVVRLECRRA